MNVRNWILFIFIMLMIIVPVSSKVIIVENRITTGGGGAAAVATGSNETLIDASECADVSCTTFIEVMT